MHDRRTALLFVIGLLVVTLIASLQLGSPKIEDASPISLVLPVNVATWKGGVPLFCQQESCMHVVSEPRDVSAPDLCPECGGSMGPTSLSELRILPTGTRLSKMIYTRGTSQISVSVVVTGSARSGIHRPEWCLPSQGLSIQRSRIDSVSLNSDQTLPLRVLEVATRGGGGLFAYWFSDKEHETALHWKRLYWMAHNDLFLGVRRPWAYVSIWMPGRVDDVAREQLYGFVKSFYLAVQKKGGKSSQ